MKTVNKKTVDELSRISRKFAKTGDGDLLEYRLTLSKMLSKEAFGSDNKWICFADLVSVCCGCSKLKDCSNAEIYKIFEILGIKVVEEEEIDGA